MANIHLERRTELGQLMGQIQRPHQRESAPSQSRDGGSFHGEDPPAQIEHRIGLLKMAPLGIGLPPKVAASLPLPTDDRAMPPAAVFIGTVPVPPSQPQVLPTLETDWIIPSPRGLRWIGENFGDRHRTLLRANGLYHTCPEYRHTYATTRAREGDSLLHIARSMGNSVAVCERYYAAYLNPNQG